MRVIETANEREKTVRCAVLHLGQVASATVEAGFQPASEDASCVRFFWLRGKDAASPPPAAVQGAG
jgi:hypothetical protein